MGMMGKFIDAKGLACPKPVILAKKAIDEGSGDFTIEVDNDTAVGNLRRLAGSSGYSAAAEADNPYRLTLTRLAGEMKSDPVPAGAGAAAPEKNGEWALFCGTDILGSGDRQLGTNLIRMYFYTLSQAEQGPAAIIFVNSGVKLAALDEQVAEHLKALIARGCRVLACGTCLDFYGLKERLKVGQVSNMYDIVTCLSEYAKVVTLG